MFRCFLLLFLFTNFTLIADNENTSDILMIGNFHGESVNAKSGETWLTLVQKEGRFYLEESRLKIEAIHDAMVDGPEEKTGKAVSVNPDNSPILLLAKSLGLKAGEVKGQSFPGHYFKNGKPQHIQFNGQPYHLQMRIPTLLKRDSKSDLELSSNKQKQGLGSYYTRAQNDSLFMFGDESAVGIIWAGDLDRDGKLDLIMSLSDHYTVMETVLLLSSRAGEGEMVKRVATFRATGC